MTTYLRSKPFVFVSHARHDKAEIPLLKQIVTALIEKGFKVWLDDPRALGFGDAEIDSCFEDLKGDRRWEDQIDEALRTAACVLLCVSSTFVERYFKDNHKKEGVIFRETSYALTDGKAVACRIDTVDYGQIPDRVAEAQVIDLVSDPGRLRDLLAAVERVMVRTLARQTEGLKAAPSRDPFLPFLANRRSQEHKAGKRMLEAAKLSVQALIVKAPQNECPDAFIDRLKRHTSSRVLANCRCSDSVTVPWPRVDDAAAFEGWFETSLKVALGPGDRDARDDLRRSREAPLLILTVVNFEDWTKQSPRSVRAWAAYWQGLAVLGTRAPLLPVLLIVTDDAKPGWKSVPSLRNARGVSTRQAWRDLKKIERDIAKRARGSGFELELLDVLGPVSRGDADDWRRDHHDQIGDSASPLYLDLGKAFNAAFAGKARATGLSMEDWSEQVRPLLTSAP